MRKNTLFALGGIGAIIGVCALAGIGLEQEATAAKRDAVQVAPREGGTYYRVLPGDTLYRIAQDHYGDARLWQIVADANNMNSPAALRAGATIFLPDASGPQAPLLIAAAAPDQGQPELATFSDEDLTIRAVPVAVQPVLYSPVSGAQAQARVIVEEIEGGTRVKLSTGQGRDEQALYDGEFSQASAGSFRFLYTKDADKDGSDEIYTVWSFNGDDYFTRTIARAGSGYGVVEWVPANPFALAREREQRRDDGK